MIEKITKFLEKRKEIENKLEKSEISFLEAEEEIKKIINEIEKIIQQETLVKVKEPHTLNTIECECGFKAKYKDIKKKISIQDEQQ